MEIELGPDPPDPYVTAQAATAAAPGGQAVPPTRAAVRGPAAPDEGHPPARARRAGRRAARPRPPALRATGLGPDPQDPDRTAPALAAATPADPARPPAGAASPEPARTRSSRGTAAQPRSGRQACRRRAASRRRAAGELPHAPGRRHRPRARPAPGSAIPGATSRPPPPVQAPTRWARHRRRACPDGRSTARISAGRTPIGCTAPPRRPPAMLLTPGVVGREGSAQTDRVQAMARSLGDAGAAARAAATTGPSISLPPALTPMDRAPAGPDRRRCTPT